MPPLEIKPVHTPSELGIFIRLPWTIYRHYPCWVPPLLIERRAFFDRRQNPFFDHAEVGYFLAWQDGEPVGRIAAILNYAHNEFHEERIGFFGAFETIDQPPVANALLETACQWVGERGMTAIRGPVTFSTNEECGLLLEGFGQPPVFLMPYNPPYYQSLVEGFGFIKAKDLLAFFRGGHPVEERLVRLADRLIERGSFQVRRLNMRRFGDEVARIRAIYNQSWSRNWGFVPMTEREFNHLAKDLKRVVDPDLVCIAEVQGQPAGFSLTLPDLNQALKHLHGRLLPIGLFKLLWYQRKIDTVRTITLGVLPEYRRRGIEAVMITRTMRDGMAKGFCRGELSWVLEDNTLMIRDIEAGGGRLYKRYRIYEKAL